MSPEEKELLQRAVALSEENNEMLRYISRSMRISRWISIAYWVLIIGSAIGAFYLIQPYVDAITGAYSGASTSFSSALKSFQELNQ